MSIYFHDLTKKLNETNIVIDNILINASKILTFDRIIGDTKEQTFLIISSLPENALLQSSVINPSGKKISDQKFHDELHTELDTKSAGKYSIKIRNLSTQTATVSIFVGHLPISGQFPNLISGINAGIICFGLGLIFIILAIALKTFYLLKK